MPLKTLASIAFALSLTGSPSRGAGGSVVSDATIAEQRKAIKQAYKTLYHSELNISQALEQLKQQASTAEVEQIIHFYEQSERGVTRHR